jgi:hypothetical protein
MKYYDRFGEKSNDAKNISFGKKSNDTKISNSG